MAAKEEVSTTRLTPRVARRAQTPERPLARRNDQIVLVGRHAGRKGRRHVQDEVAARDSLAPAFVRARGRRRRMSDSRPGPAPPTLSIARTSASRARLRTVVRTSWPAASNCRMQWLPMNPEPPVTRTLVMRFSASPAPKIRRLDAEDTSRSSRRRSSLAGPAGSLKTGDVRCARSKPFSSAALRSRPLSAPRLWPLPARRRTC